MPSTSFSTGDQLVLGALVVAMSTLIMWFSARIVGLPRAGFLDALKATIGVSVVTAVALSLMSGLAEAGAIALGIGAVIGGVLVIRVVFQIKTFPAILIWLVNVMVQILVVSFYWRTVLGQMGEAKPQ